MRTFAVVTFGCQMNQHDSERIGDVLRGAGYSEAKDAARADVVVLNTCSVREKAEHKLRSEVGRLAMRKREQPDLVIGVAGCVAQQEGERLVRDQPAIDVLIGPDNIAELPGLLAEVENGAPPQVRTVFDLEDPRFLIADPVPGRQGPTAFVTTMKGCDERCSFCIVPTTRGPERYRPSDEIVEEIRRVVGAGAAEVTLLGQTVNSYREPTRASPSEESEFPELLRRIADEIPALRRLRYTSPHPRHLTPALVSAHRDLPVLAKHVHMPVQSGSDAMLKRMIRRYTAAEYLDRLAALRDAVPGITISTDVIVGFPGETLDDFEATLELVRRAGFVSVYGFKYSPRPGTPSLRFDDDVPEDEKARRLDALFGVSEAMRYAHLESLVDSTVEVLVEGPGRTGGYTGRSERSEIVHLGSRRDLTGEIVAAHVRRAFKHSLQAELVDPEDRAPLPAPKSRAKPHPISLPVV